MAKYDEIPPCPVCGTPFDNVFEATDHLIEDEDGEEFDPKLILPNGYSLMVGSLLRCLFSYADDPAQIKSITQSTYATLYAAETDPGNMKSIIEDIVVHEHMSDIDKEIETLLKQRNRKHDDKGGA
jgi:hypothetical protein